MYWLLRCGKGCTRIMNAGLSEELLEGLRFVDPSKDWLTHMQQLMPIENPKGVAGLAKQKFADSYSRV